MAETIKVRWSRVCIDEKCFIYGPRLGALYLLPFEESRDKILFTTLGLRPCHFTGEITDPASHVLHDMAGFKEISLPHPATFWCFFYRFIYHTRHIIPFRLQLKGMTQLARLQLKGMTQLARLRQRTGVAHSPSEIGKILHTIESRIGIRDCYPRAIITAYLCAKSKLSWDVVIGILSPTRMMHAWCSTNGILPYEPFPEHYMYQPLIVFSRTYP